MENFVNVVLCGLAVNLLACIIWNVSPGIAAKIRERVPWMDKFLNLTVAVILLFACTLFSLLTNDKMKPAAQGGPAIRTAQARTVPPGIKPGAITIKASDGQPLSSSTAATLNKLVDVILQEQTTYVGESFGPDAHENFTRVQLRIFKEEDTPGKIVKALGENQRFLSIVTAIRAMPAAEQQEVLSRAGHTYHPTWNQLEMDSTIDSREELRRGQTEAGQEGERLIAQRIVALVKSLL